MAGSDLESMVGLCREVLNKICSGESEEDAKLFGTEKKKVLIERIKEVD